ncbi:MAG: molecular chaperone HtpG [Chloroflexota bacterium]
MSSLPLSIRLFGNFQVELGAQDVTAMLRTEKERALLAYLAMEPGRSYTREALAELLWPDRVEAVARTSLRQALLGVRRAIGDREAASPFLLTDDEKISFSGEKPYWLDTEVFNTCFQQVYTHTHKSLETCLTCAQRLQEAVELYRGDFMAGLLLSDSPGFQEWVTIYREQFFRYLISAIHTLSNYFQHVGDFDLSLQYARRLVSLDPLDESTHQRLMYILAVSGKRAAALEQYQTCCRTLKNELGVEPSSETVAIYEKIRKGEAFQFKPVTGSLRRVNLPAQFTSFIGRETELEWLDNSFKDPMQRLISILGMGGVGKTRLALQAAERNAQLFADGVYYVALENITSSDLLVPSIANGVGLSFRGDAEPQKQLIRFLRPLRSLIVIDSVEHMLEQMPLFIEILQQAPGVTLLLTSRWRLHYQAAAVLELKGLPYSQDLHAPNTADYPAVKLFISRAVHSQADFSFMEKDLPHIVQICRLVDGLPLALELAASRVRELSCEQIASHLQSDLAVLQSTMLDIPERHRNIRTAFDSCWQRIDAMERLIYQRLSVFQDGFNLAGAQAVAEASLALLSTFMARSLLLGDASRGFTLPRLLKRYAAEKLAENPEERERILDLHSHYYTEYLHQCNEQLNTGNASRELLREIDSQIENIRSALSRASFRRQTASFTKGMDALQRFYELRNEYRQTKPLETPQTPAVQEKTPTARVSQSIAFKPETRQLLDILIHTSFAEREVFLREMIANAADALTRMSIELLGNRSVYDAGLPLSISITADRAERTLTITDTGLGMTLAEMSENLGSLVNVGARALVEAAKTGGKNVSDVICQFGVGFYSAFMVAEHVRVEARSFRPETHAAVWSSDGSETFTVEAGERRMRGTRIVLKLREDAAEFLQEDRLREIILCHCNFITFPIYLGDSEQQVNRRQTIWRQTTREVSKADYEAFYRQMTLEQDAPLACGHLVVDVPVKTFALLYIPSRLDRSLFSPRRKDGLSLYAQKTLVQAYCADLLPQYFGFVQGVVDVEDLPLNVSHETIQASRTMGSLKKLVTGKVIDILMELSSVNKAAYHSFWQEFGRSIKEGIATEPLDAERLSPLLRFHTTESAEAWVSLDEYIRRKKPQQNAVYYILGDDERTVRYSPHLDVIRYHQYEVLLLTDPVDAFMLAHLTRYGGLPLINVVNADLKMPEAVSFPVTRKRGAPIEDGSNLLARFKQVLKERVSDVRITNRLSDSPARLVDPESGPSQQLQRMYRLLQQDFVMPKKVLELNPHHPILVQFNALPDDSPLIPLIVEQVYENTLLVEGLHPDPAGMIHRIQKLMEEALEK